MSKTDRHDGDQVPGDGEVLEGEVTGLAEYNAAILSRQPGLREAFMAMLMAVPEPASDEEVTARIVAEILAAEEEGDVDSPWDSDGLRKHPNEILVISAITRRPSDYQGGLGVYLGCEVVSEATGEQRFMSTGSVSCVAQLVRLHALGRLPVRVVVTPAPKPTPNGYLPYHLTILPRLGARGTAS